MTVVAISNRKGGTGKTTTAVNLAACLADCGRTTLLIDMDPQANATVSLGLPMAGVDEGVPALLAKDGTVDELRSPSCIAGLDVLAAGPQLAAVELELTRRDGIEGTLRGKLAGGGYDFVVIDTPPALGVLTVNSLVAADGVLVPLMCDYLSLEGLSEFARNLDSVREQFNPGLRLLGLVKTMYDGRTLLTRQVATELDRYFGDKVLHTAVPRTVRLAEAPSYGTPIIMHDPGCSGAKAYQQLAREFIEAVA